ncbi:MAG: hypothetical protein ACXV0U_00480 [Kineosporiaceae bacterium]
MGGAVVGDLQVERVVQGALEAFGDVGEGGRADREGVQESRRLAILGAGGVVERLQVGGQLRASGGELREALADSGSVVVPGVGIEFVGLVAVEFGDQPVLTGAQGLEFALDAGALLVTGGCCGVHRAELGLEVIHALRAEDAQGEEIVDGSGELVGAHVDDLGMVRVPGLIAVLSTVGLAGVVQVGASLHPVHAPAAVLAHDVGAQQVAALGGWVGAGGSGRA